MLENQLAMLRDELNHMFNNFSTDAELLSLGISGRWIRGYYGNQTSYKKHKKLIFRLKN